MVSVPEFSISANEIPTLWHRNGGCVSFPLQKKCTEEPMLQCASVANAVKWFFPCIMCLCVCNDNYILECLELDLSDDVMTQDC